MFSSPPSASMSWYAKQGDLRVNIIFARIEIRFCQAPDFFKNGFHLSDSAFLR